ncbi:DUF2510 domain-containing protein [Mycolicibacterium lutetiense]
MTTGLPAPGWYPDPSGEPGQMYWDGQGWNNVIAAATLPADAPTTAEWAPQTNLMPSPETHTLMGQAFHSPPTNAYVYKNPVLYALGGFFFPPLVLFLMGGSRTTCLIMLGLWVLFWLTVWFFFIGVIFLVANYFWSAVACYQEAVKQNQAHGFG